MTSTTNIWTAAAAAGLTAGVAAAGVSQADAPAPGGFIQAACFAQSNGSAGAGQDLEMVGSPADLDEAVFGGASSAVAAASFSNGAVTNTGSGEAAMGYALLAGTNTFPNNAPFASGRANGGWKESFQIDHPGLDGQPGFFLVQLRATGPMSAAGFAGAAGLEVRSYKDDGALLKNDFFDDGASDPISTSLQQAQWGVSTFASGDFDSRVVDDAVIISVPITFGEPFTLGLYGQAIAGQRSASGVAGSSSSEIDCAIFWGGIAGVVEPNGSPVAGFTLTSGTAVDWSGEVAPPACDEDLDGSGGIDSADLNVILANFGCSGGGCPGDIDADGDTDSADLNALLAAFGEVCP